MLTKKRYKNDKKASTLFICKQIEISKMSWKEWITNTRYTLYRTAVIQSQFIECVIDHTPKGGSLLETGIGQATTLELFRDMGYQTHGFDLEPLVIKKCKERFPVLGKNLYVADILSKTSYTKHVDTIIHQGVLEHFEDDEIRKILKAQILFSNRIIFDVPNNMRADLSDEGDRTRFETPQFWENIIDSVGLTYQRYGRTYDYGDEYVPGILKRYDSDLMKKVGRSSIFVVDRG